MIYNFKTNCIKMNVAQINTNKTFYFEQLNKKPFFAQPSSYKMAE